MKRKHFIIAGCACLAFLLINTWYSINFNEGRILYPMDYSVYSFRLEDLPYIIAIAAGVLYILALFGVMIFTIIKKRMQESKYTRQLNPKLGFLGVLGFLGFTGFWTYANYGFISPLVFFVFFGFFGFFYEGKMSGTFMDERFQANAAKAQLHAYKTGFILIFIILLFAGGQSTLSLTIEQSALFMLSAISLSFAIVIFLSEYLLYRYDALDKEDE